MIGGCGRMRSTQRSYMSHVSYASDPLTQTTPNQSPVTIHLFSVPGDRGAIGVPAFLIGPAKLELDPTVRCDDVRAFPVGIASATAHS